MPELIADKRGPWTFAELASLPESPWRYEIVDGSLVMSPSPDLRHEGVAALLRQSLTEALGPTRVVLGPMGVDLHPSYRIPDLVVVDRALLSAGNRPLLQHDDVRLVVEVVSPGSSTTDRVTKPAQYAAGGIVASWRVETDPAVWITAYVLREQDRVYTELGTWSEGETLRVREPFELVVDVSRCAP